MRRQVPAEAVLSSASERPFNHRVHRAGIQGGAGITGGHSRVAQDKGGQE